MSYIRISYVIHTYIMQPTEPQAQFFFNHWSSNNENPKKRVKKYGYRTKKKKREGSFRRPLSPSSALMGPNLSPTTPWSAGAREQTVVSGVYRNRHSQEGHSDITTLLQLYYSSNIRAFFGSIPEDFGNRGESTITTLPMSNKQWQKHHKKEHTTANRKKEFFCFFFTR